MTICCHFFKAIGVKTSRADRNSTKTSRRGGCMPASRGSPGRGNGGKRREETSPPPRKPKRRKQVMPGGCYTPMPYSKGVTRSYFTAGSSTWLGCKNVARPQVLAAEYCPGNGQRVTC